MLKSNYSGFHSVNLKIKINLDKYYEQPITISKMLLFLFFIKTLKDFDNL